MFVLADFWSKKSAPEDQPRSAWTAAHYHLRAQGVLGVFREVPARNFYTEAEAQALEVSPENSSKT